MLYIWLYSEKEEMFWSEKISPGWYHAFGEEFISGLHKLVLKYDLVYRYKVFDVGEEYGALKWNDNAEIPEIKLFVQKYIDLSKTICFFCGAPDARFYTAGWPHYACDKCSPDEKVPRKIKLRKTEFYGS